MQGDRPTIDRVRMKLGRGSLNTINEHLDAWWSRLGARLRDVPGQELPHLPEGIALRLQQLWHEALDTARATLHGTLAQRESDLGTREQALAEREQAALERAAALEDGLALVREQLTAANERAAALEGHLNARTAEAQRLSEQIEHWHGLAREAQMRTDAALTAHATERAELQAHSTQAERHWMLELDRTRQAARDSAQKHEQAVKDARRQVEDLRAERQERMRELSALRTDLHSQQAARAHLQSQLSTLLSRSAPAAKASVAPSLKGNRRTQAAPSASKSSRRKSTRS